MSPVDRHRLHVACAHGRDLRDLLEGRARSVELEDRRPCPPARLTRHVARRDQQQLRLAAGAPGVLDAQGRHRANAGRGQPFPWHEALVGVSAAQLVQRRDAYVELCDTNELLLADAKDLDRTATPSEEGVRVWGCLGASKAHPQGIPCLHLRRSDTQPGWRMLSADGRIYTTPHVDFVEDCTPGITLNKRKEEQIVPPFARDYDPDAPFAPGRVSARPPADPTIGSGGPGQPTARGGNGAAGPSSSAGGGQDGVIDPISQRLSRPARDEASAKGKYIDAFSAGTPAEAPVGPYVIYLCSGPRRDGDLQTAQRIGCLSVDPIIDARSFDLLNDSVVSRLIELATSANCVGIMASFPCSTWSAARFEPGGPRGTVAKVGQGG